MKNPTKTPWGFSQNPPPPGFFKLNSPPPWGMGVGTPWGPRGVWGWGPNPIQNHCIKTKIWGGFALPIPPLELPLSSSYVVLTPESPSFAEEGRSLDATEGWIY